MCFCRAGGAHKRRVGRQTDCRGIYVNPRGPHLSVSTGPASANLLNAKQFAPTADRLAVIAHVRHQYTKYKRLLVRYNDRQEARSEVRGTIEQVLDKWEQPE